ncbi:MAG: hypothetical protein HY918_03785 [Candidatus Doudnabacteria bacterium]|nr:hypothetical protein [Candidatus Doudnabacteria bacterium]
MEVLNVFPPSPRDTVVVVSSLELVTLKDYDLPVRWLSLWQLCQMMSNQDLLQTIGLADCVIIMGLHGLVAPWKKRQIHSFCRHWGVKTLCWTKDEFSLLRSCLKKEAPVSTNGKEALSPLSHHVLVCGVSGLDSLFSSLDYLHFSPTPESPLNGLNVGKITEIILPDDALPRNWLKFWVGMTPPKVTKVPVGFAIRYLQNRFSPSPQVNANPGSNSKKIFLVVNASRPVKFKDNRLVVWTKGAEFGEEPLEDFDQVWVCPSDVDREAREEWRRLAGCRSAEFKEFFSQEELDQLCKQAGISPAQSKEPVAAKPAKTENEKVEDGKDKQVPINKTVSVASVVRKYLGLPGGTVAIVNAVLTELPHTSRSTIYATISQQKNKGSKRPSIPAVPAKAPAQPPSPAVNNSSPGDSIDHLGLAIAGLQAVAGHLEHVKGDLAEIFGQQAELIQLLVTQQRAAKEFGEGMRLLREGLDALGQVAPAVEALNSFVKRRYPDV